MFDKKKFNHTLLILNDVLLDHMEKWQTQIVNPVMLLMHMTSEVEIMVHNAIADSEQKAKNANDVGYREGWDAADKMNREVHAKRANELSQKLDNLAYYYAQHTKEVWLEEYARLVESGSKSPKIELIKQFRSTTGCGLKVCKEEIERIIDSAPPKQQECSE